MILRRDANSSHDLSHECPWLNYEMDEYKEREDEYQERGYDHDCLQMASEIDGSL